MKPLYLFLLAAAWCSTAFAQVPLTEHPDTSGDGWVDLFRPDLSNSIRPEGVWTVEDGVLTASEDQALWTSKVYDDFILDLEFKNAPGTNSGVIIHTSDVVNWIPNSVEIQIADDYADQWANAPANWQAGAVFGRKGADAKTVKQPGEWNRYTIAAQGTKIWVMLNGTLVNEVDMRDYTSAKTNPDGSEVPNWLSIPMAELPDYGHIGFQGKHAGAPIYFRNLKIKPLP